MRLPAAPLDGKLWGEHGLFRSLGIHVKPPLESHECRHKGGDSPPSERGGAAMDGMSMHGRRKTAGAATGGVLRLAVAASATPPRQRTNRALYGWTTRKHAATATRSTPSAALSIRSAAAIQNPSFTGLHPPLGGGRMHAHPPFSKYLSAISRPSSPSTKFPEEAPPFSVPSVFCAAGPFVKGEILVWLAFGAVRPGKTGNAAVGAGVAGWGRWW